MRINMPDTKARLDSMKYSMYPLRTNQSEKRNECKNDLFRVNCVPVIYGQSSCACVFAVFKKHFSFVKVAKKCYFWCFFRIAAYYTSTGVLCNSLANAIFGGQREYVLPKIAT